MQPLKIFISSDMDLKAERSVAEVAVRELWQEPALFEKLPSHPKEPMVMCSNEIITSDMVILIIADKITSPVRKEYEKASEKGIDILVFAKEMSRPSETDNFLEILKIKHKVRFYRELSKKDVKDAIIYRLNEKLRDRMKPPKEKIVSVDMQGTNEPVMQYEKIKIRDFLKIKMIHGDCALGNDRAEHWIVKKENSENEINIGCMPDFGSLTVRGKIVGYDKIGGEDPFVFNFIPKEIGEYILLGEMGCRGGGGKRLIIHLTVEE
jgi:hypothetical protein